MCEQGKQDAAIRFIDVYGFKSKPDKINEKGNTALMCAIKAEARDVAIKLIDTFGLECNPSQVNNTGNTALMFACVFKMDDVANKLIEMYTSPPYHQIYYQNYGPAQGG